MKTKLFITAIILLTATVLANAGEKDAGQEQQNPPVRGMWVDANNNGICDNFEARAAAGFSNSSRPFIRGGRQGRNTEAAPRNIRPGRGYGRNNINAGATGYGRNNINTVRGYGNYTDANNNGVCDYREIPE